MKISEYVSTGHPDKTTDYIVSYILDDLIKKDKNTRFALECQIKNNFISLAGEVSTNAIVDYKELTKKAIEDIGYTGDYCKLWGENNTINPNKLEIVEHIFQQTNDIAVGVNSGGWGDNGIFFGFATNNEKYKYFTKDYFYAKKLCQYLYNLVKNGDLKQYGLDIKTLIVCNDNNKIVKCVVSIPAFVEEHNDLMNIIKEQLDEDDKYDIIVNGTGSYKTHSSVGDSGTTGRKLVVDFYGGGCQIGGGSPWTKDGTKADLALNIYARELAVKQIKLHPELKEIKTSIACAIGKQEIHINDGIKTYIENRPNYEIIEELGLYEPCFAYKCNNGLFETK